jgi:hypothetical protein
VAELGRRRLLGERFFIMLDNLSEIMVKLKQECQKIAMLCVILTLYNSRCLLLHTHSHSMGSY